MDLIARMEAAEFLGSEFLMWLYWQAATNEPTARIDLTEGGSLVAPDGCSRISVAFTRGAVLADPVAKERVTVQDADPACSAEIHHALRQAKRFAQARVALAWCPGGADAREYEATVKASTLAMSGVDLPAVLASDGNVTSVALERAMLVAELDALVLALYRTFLDVRLCDDWYEEARKIRVFVRGTLAADGGGADA